jgi:hypothetical protein
LTQSLHILRSIDVNQLHSGSEGTQSEALIELSFYKFYFLQLYSPLVIHESDLIVVTVYAEVGTGNDLSYLEEVKAFQSQWGHFLSIIDESELVETFSLVVNLYPCVIGHVCENLVLGLQAEMLIKLARCFRAVDIMLPTFPC